MLEKRSESQLKEATPRPRLLNEYVSPCLVEYGSIAKLTQNGQGSGNDGGPNAGMMMVCL